MNSLHLNNEHVAAIQKYSETIPLKYRRSFLKVALGRGGKREIIKVKCQSCVNFEDVSARVGGCTSILCPTWPYRPYQQTEIGGSNE